MINRMIRWGTIPMFLASFCGASTVIKVGDKPLVVAITGDDEAPWNVKDKACVFHDEVKVGCGRILKVGTSGAILGLDSQDRPLVSGDVVRRPAEEADAADNPDGKTAGEGDETFGGEKETKTMSRTELVDFHRELIHAAPAPDSDDVPSLSEKLSLRWNLGIGLEIFGNTSGGSSIWPFATLQTSLTRNYVIGIAAGSYGFDAAGSQNKFTGGMVTFDYYPTALFHGIHLKAGVGLANTTYSVASATTGSISAGTALSYNLLATMGWRWLFFRHLNFGLEAGAQYFSFKVAALPDGAGSGTLQALLPVFFVDVGFAF